MNKEKSGICETCIVRPCCSKLCEAKEVEDWKKLIRADKVFGICRDCKTRYDCFEACDAKNQEIWGKFLEHPEFSPCYLKSDISDLSKEELLELIGWTQIPRGNRPIYIEDYKIGQEVRVFLKVNVFYFHKENCAKRKQEVTDFYNIVLEDGDNG